MDARLICSLATLTLLAAPARPCDEVAGAASCAGTVANLMLVGGEEDRHVVQWSDGHAVEVRIADGEVTVSIDGKPLPADRVRREDGRIVITDEQGNERQLFGAIMGDRLFGPGAFAFRFAGEDGGEPFAFAWDDLTYEPKVMMGIHLDRPGPALEKHLGLAAGATTMISGLYEGLPADEAGLELYDIITAVDGQTPADPGAVTEALAAHEPGDAVELKVIQAGRGRTVRVTLEAFDRGRMADAKLHGSSPGVRWFDGVFEPGEGWRELLVDPQNNRFFRLPTPDTERIQERVREQLRRFEGFVEREAETGLDQRLDDINTRIDELRRMLDKLVEKAKELSRE